MRADPDLCFLEKVGRPDVTALSADQGGGGGGGGREGIPDMVERYPHVHKHALVYPPQWRLMYGG